MKREGEVRPSEPRRQAARRLLLEHGPASAGACWAAGWRDDLIRDGRPAAGGWPGTVREARLRVTAALAPELSRRNLPALTPEELERAARVAYAAARREWLLHVVRDTGDL
jgi:hypothetical protein